MINQDSLIQANYILIDSIKVLNTQHGFWYGFKLVDTNVLIIIAITFSSVFSLFLSWFLHRKTYIDEYYKALYNKRLDSYNTLDKFLNHFRTYLYRGQGEYKFYRMYESAEKFKNFINELIEIQEKITWLNEDIVQNIREFANFLIKNVDYSLTDTKLNEKGVNHFHYLTEFHIKMRKSLLYDFSRLHNINKFIKQKKKSYKKENSSQPVVG